MSINIQGLRHTYAPKTPFAYEALKGIDLTIDLNKTTAIIGHTGSGKSTLIQHFNGLLIPSAGQLTILGQEIVAGMKKKSLKSLRQLVGLVFQFPEYQLFEESVEKDIAFGPKNFDIDQEEIKRRIQAVLPKVGLDESLLERSVFSLSGGQKRKVALAGILVLEPKVLILDEPTAGLDPLSTQEMMDLFSQLDMSIIMVTHNMNHVFNYCDEVIVMQEGRLCYQGEVDDFFTQRKLIQDLELEAPDLIQLAWSLKDRGIPIELKGLTEEKLLEQVVAHVR